MAVAYAICQSGTTISQVRQRRHVLAHSRIDCEMHHCLSLHTYYQAHHLRHCAQVFGAPLAAGLLAMDGLGGLDGWQWLFLAEGLPTIAFGLWLRWTLASEPATAGFLEPPERAWLAARNEAHKVCGCV